VVVIGGLLTSTLLTLVVLPTLFPWFERKTDRRPPAEHIEAEPQPELAMSER
jgi:cobalt-zinc-cadmium resistance protein CzcA